MKQSFKKLCTLIGEPKNYGPTPEEQAEMERVKQEEKVLIAICNRRKHTQ